MPAALQSLHTELTTEVPAWLVPSWYSLDNSWTRPVSICAQRRPGGYDLPFPGLWGTLMWDKEPQLSGSHLGIILSLPSIKTPRSFSCKCLLSQLPASCLPVSPELRADEIFLNPDSFFEHMNTHIQLCVNSRCGQLPFVSSLKVLMRLSNRIRPGQKPGPHWGHPQGWDESRN